MSEGQRYLLFEHYALEIYIYISTYKKTFLAKVSLTVENDSTLLNYKVWMTSQLSNF